MLSASSNDFEPADPLAPVRELLPFPASDTVLHDDHKRHLLLAGSALGRPVR
jgi:hypothetical protein